MMKRERKGDPVRLKGMRIPYTFWPDGYIRHGRLVASNPWHCMLAYVHRNVKNHVLQKSALAFLEQSHDLYFAASGSRTTARPLLFYYSYLNLAKAYLVVRKNRLLRGKPGHGLSDVSYRTGQYVTIRTQTVEVNPRGKELHIYRELIEDCGFEVPISAQTSLKDLLTQVVGIYKTVSQTLNLKKGFFYPIAQIDFLCDSFYVWVSVRILRENLPAAHKIISTTNKYLEEVEPLTEGDSRIFESKEKRLHKGDPTKHLPDLVESTKKDIWSVLRPGKYEFYLSSLPAKIRLAQVASNYQTMFYFGSVARYRPDDFVRLLEGRYGWLVQEFINTQPLQFIYLLGSNLIGAEMIVPEAVIG